MLENINTKNNCISILVILLTLILSSYSKIHSSQYYLQLAEKEVKHNQKEDAFKNLVIYMNSAEPELSTKLDVVFKQITFEPVLLVDSFNNHLLNILFLQFDSMCGFKDIVASNVILSHYIKDQRIRNRYEFLKTYNIYKIDSFMPVWQKIDSLNFIAIKPYLDFIATHNNPGYYGISSLYHMFMIVQHSSYTNQKIYFPIFKAASDSSLLSKHALALMEDRMLLHEGKPQKYGTQLSCNSKYCKPQNHISIDSMNYYRKMIGLNDVRIFWKENNVKY